MSPKTKTILETRRKALCVFSVLTEMQRSRLTALINVISFFHVLVSCLLQSSFSLSPPPPLPHLPCRHQQNLRPVLHPVIVGRGFYFEVPQDCLLLVVHLFWSFLSEEEEVESVLCD